MRILTYGFIILLIITNIKTLIRIIRTSNFLKNNKDLNLEKCKNKIIKIIIPVMNEVTTVEKSINYFKELSEYCECIYVTTSKEQSMATYNKIKELMKKLKTKNIQLINCPNTYGTMATQINYVIKELKKDDIIAIYNIDSFPEIKTFQYVLQNINSNNVLQQVSYFDDKHKFIMKSCQNWQNRWSFVYELGKYTNKNRYEFKYCIGHGLFIKKELFDKYGYLSDEEINEDNEFGYRLLINNIKIEPIPFMEQAGFANNLKIYIKQQSTWVNGPLYAFSYYKKNKKNFRNLILTILNFKAFLSWWLFPLFSLLFLIVSIYINWKTFTIGLLLIINYITVYNLIVSLQLKKMGYLKEKIKVNIISDLVFFMVHSFVSYITLYKICTKKNNIKNKYNTEK